MHKLFFITSLLWGMLSSHSSGQSAQNDTGRVSLPPQPGEQLALYADRNLYCSGEEILFAIGYERQNHLRENWSNVVYVELIRWNGDKLTASKYPLNDTGGSGSIKIPGNTLSGNYYLRAYTKWMRNFSVYHYAYTPLKIVNPYKVYTDSVPHKTKKTNHIDSLGTHVPNQVITCTTTQSVYRKREQVKLHIALPDDVQKKHDYVYVSVAKAGSVNDQPLHISTRESGQSPSTKTLEYRPDIRGVSLSGKIIDSHSGKPLKNTVVNLSTPISSLYFSGFKTTREGYFNFTFPPDLKGTHDFYLNVQTHDSVVADIRIDSDFCNKPVTLSHIPFELTRREKELAQEIMLNHQLQERYQVQSPDSLLQYTNNQPFYGQAQHIIHTETYIELPNMEEFFFELVPQVQVLYHKKKPSLRIVKRTSLTGLYPPLLLVDNIPVQENKLLAIPNNRIERIEVINDGYVAGNLKFNGLVSLYSKNNDMAGIEIHPNSMFFSYQLLSRKSSAPRNNPPVNHRIPDRRNTLYWHPALKIGEQSETDLSFYTSDNTGEYVVYVRARKANGTSLIYGKCSFTVKE